MKTSPVAKKFRRLSQWLRTPLFWDNLLAWTEMRAAAARRKIGQLQKAWRTCMRQPAPRTFKPCLEGLEVRYVPTLSVSSFSVNPSGFSAVFSAPINPNTVTLYTTGPGTLVPDDVTLTGGPSSPSISYPGSLIIDPTDTTITFVKSSNVPSSGSFDPTGALLAAGTYTATFRSASNGFKDMSGNLLNSGSNFVTSFVVSSSAADVLGIPDFARGPGNEINVPTTSIGIPISLSSGSNATSGQLTLQYNSSLLDITGVTGNVQTINFGGTVTGGTFTLALNGNTTAAISYSCDAGEMIGNIQSALDSLATVGPGDAVVNIGSSTAVYQVALLGPLAAVSQSTLTTTSSLTGSSPTVSVTNNAISGETLKLDLSSNLPGGTAVMDMAATTALTGSSVTLGVLVANVPASTASVYDSSALLYFNSGATTLSGTGGSISLNLVSAVQVNNYLGNATATGGINSGDPTQITRIVNATDTNSGTGTLGGFAFPLRMVDPYIVGNVAGSGSLTSASATDVTNYLSPSFVAPLSLTVPEANALMVTAPSTVTTGVAFSFSVTALYNSLPTPSFAGSLTFRSSDASATLPGTSTLVLGQGTFTGTLVTGGSHTITCIDVDDPDVTGTCDPIGVTGSTFNAYVRVADPVQSEMVSVGNAEVLPNTGAVLLSHDLALNASPDTPTLGGDPALVYNSGTVSVQPIIEVDYASSSSTTLSSLQAAISWNTPSGSPSYGTLTTFSTTGHSLGDIYALALQVPSAVTATGYYPFQVELEVTYGMTTTTLYYTAGEAAVVVEGSSDPFGEGWSLAGTEQLVAVTGGALLVDGGTGTARFFASSGGGFTSPPNDFGTLAASGSNYIYTAPDTTAWNFNSSGNLTSIVDPNGLTRSFSYTSGLLTVISDPDSTSATFSYSSSLLSTIQAPGGRTTTISINGTSKNLISITNPDGGLETFTYDSNHHVTGDQFAPLGPVTYTYNSTYGTVTSIVLDSVSTYTIAAANIVPTATSPAADFSQVVGVVTDPNTHAVTYTMDALSRLSEQQTLDGGSGTLAQTWNLYPSGLVETYTDALLIPTAYAYDGSGDLTNIYYADTTSEAYTYNLTFHEPATYTDQDNNITDYNYDGSGNLTETIDPATDRTTSTWSSGELVQVQDPDGNFTTYTYDSFRRLQTVKDPDGDITTYLYDAAGNTSGVQDPDGNLTATTYDLMGRPTSSTVGAGTSVAATSYSQYDAYGDLLQTTDPNGIIDRYFYDAQGRQTGMITADASAYPQSTTTKYDPAGNITQTLDTQALSGSTSISAASGSPISLGAQPENVVAGDFNADGKSDLVMLYSNANAFRVLLGNGNGTFAAGSSYATGNDPVYAVVGDFNGDGKLDLAIGDMTASALAIYLGNGNGTFGSATTYSLGSSGDVETIVAADFNGDGKLDLAANYFPSSGTGAVAVLLGNGNGTFTSPVNYGIGNGPTGLAVGDFNNDGKPDLVAVNANSDTFSILLGNGNGTFVNATNYSTTYAGGYVVVADFNNDGKQDLAVTDFNGGGVLIFLGNGNGTFQNYSFVNLGVNNLPITGLALTGGNNSDLLVLDNTSPAYMFVLAGNGDGTFAVQGSYSTGSTPYAAAVADLNGDGTADIAVANYGSSTVSIFLESVSTTTTTTAYDYDTLNRQVAVTNPLSETTTTIFDADDDVVAVQQPLDPPEQYEPDVLGQVTVTIDPSGAFSDTDYYNNGQVEAVTDLNGNITEYQYDDAGRLTTTTVAVGTTYSLSTTNYYDDASNMTGVLDYAGHITSYLYDKAGRLTETIYPPALSGGSQTTVTMLYDKAGNVTDQTDQMAIRTTFAYDGQDRLASTTAAVGTINQVTGITYDPDGNVLTTSDGLGRKTTYLYNSQNLPRFTIDATGAKTANLYDLDGNLTQMTDPNGMVTDYQYDSADELTTTIVAVGTGAVSTTTYFYNTNGVLTGTVDPLSHLTTYILDADGRTIETITPLTATLTTATTTLYDPVGNMTEVIDGDSNITTYLFDGLNRVTSASNHLGATTTLDTTLFNYNAAGYLANEKDPLGRVTSYLYDAFGRVTTQYWYDASANLTQTFSSTYDADGRLITATNNAGTYTMLYDALNRVTYAYEPFSAALSMGYDAANERTELQDYEQGGGTPSGTETFLFDAVGRETSLTYYPGTTSATAMLEVDEGYNAGGQLISTTYYYEASGSKVQENHTSYLYDAGERMTGIQYYKPNNTTLGTIGYSYNAANELTAEQDNAGTPNSYTYDYSGQLTADGSNNYSYDSAGNRTNSGYSTAAGNEVSTATINSGTWTYTYDAVGNITQEVDNAGNTWTYQYNNANQMITAKEVNGGSTLVQVTYTYDYFGNLIEEDYTVSGTTTKSQHAYDYWNPAESLGQVWADLNGSASSVEVARYIRGDQVDQVFSEVYSGFPNWLLTDRQESVRYGLTESGGLEVTVTYDAWGNATKTGTAFYSGEYLWNGTLQDPAGTGLYYNGARFYDPRLGRWTTQDPMGFDAGDSNLYRYVNNGPTDGTDPSGLEPNRADATTLEDFIDLVKSIEKSMAKENNDKAPSPLVVLREVAEQLRSATISQSGSGSGKGVIPRKLIGIGNPADQRGWNYLYTKDKGWVDLPHFTYCALRGSGAATTMAGSIGVEMFQGLPSVPYKITKGTISSSFTYEDIPSNLLGCEFRYAYFKDNVPLSKQLNQFFTSIGATSPKKAPNWASMPKSEAAWEEKTGQLDGVVRGTLYLGPGVLRPAMDMAKYAPKATGRSVATGIGNAIVPVLGGDVLGAVYDWFVK